MVSVMHYDRAKIDAQLAEQDAEIELLIAECNARIEAFFTLPNKSWQRALTADEFDDDQFRDENGDERIY